MVHSILLYLHYLSLILMAISENIPKPDRIFTHFASAHNDWIAHTWWLFTNLLNSYDNSCYIVRSTIFVSSFNKMIDALLRHKLFNYTLQFFVTD